MLWNVFGIFRIIYYHATLHYSAVYAMALYVFVCHKPVFYQTAKHIITQKCRRIAQGLQFSLNLIFVKFQ